MYIYLFLGTLHSGRVELLTNLINNGLEATDTPQVLTHQEDPISEDPALAPYAHTWHMQDSEVIAENISEETSHLFFITHGAQNPVDQIEAFAQWLEDKGLELTRVLTLLDCPLAHAHPSLLPWFQACIHFSDVVFLNFKQSAPPKGFNQLLKKLQADHSPCLFEYLKKGSTPNPQSALYPEARRLSHLFDDIDPIDALIIDEENLPQESFTLEKPVDPYLERLESGLRAKVLPEIAAYLPGTK